MELNAPSPQDRDYALERLVMLSDGVFAIAMTLMAFDVRPPEHWNHTMQSLLDSMAGPFQAFFWSFFSTAMFWSTHRRMFSVYARSDAMITSINMVLLGEITLIPVVTRITDLTTVGGGLIVYLGLFGLIGVTNAASWLYAAAAGIIQPRRGVRTHVVAAFAHALIPVTMTALGVLGISGHRRWLLALMPVVLFVPRAMRWLGQAYDERRSAAPLQADPAPGQVTDDAG